MSMSPKTKLTVASEEIKEILRKHDIAGVVSLHTVGHGHYFIHPHTSYSCAYHLDDSEIRIYAKRSDFASKEEQIQKLSDTANMFEILKKCLGTTFLTVESISDRLNDMTNAEHDIK